MPVPIGAATMQSLVQWAAPSVLQEADLQSLLDMMNAADFLGLPVSDQRSHRICYETRDSWRLRSWHCPQHAHLTQQ